MDTERTTSIVEAILFCSDHPIGLNRILETFDGAASEGDILGVLETIRAKYLGSGFGFELRQAQNGYHFCTKVENADWVRKFLQSKPFRLGKSTLETLSIIAYRQPITRAEIDKIRAIDSSHLIRTLIERGLVKMAGKAEVPGRPVQYATTPKFLEVVGLNTLSDLPPLSELEQLKGTIDENADNMEKNLERFVDEKLTTSEEPAGEYQEGLEQIDEMLAGAIAADREVYESELHGETARENLTAVEAFQTSAKPKRRTIQNSELPAGPAPDPASVTPEPSHEFSGTSQP